MNNVDFVQLTGRTPTTEEALELARAAYSEIGDVPGGRRKKPTVLYTERDAFDAFDKSTVLALDLETGGLSPWRDPVAVVSLFDAEQNTAAILHVRGHIGPELRKFLGRADRMLITHNGPCFDYLFLANNGVDVFQPVWYDTMIGALCASVTSRRDVRVSLQAELNRRSGRKISKTLSTSPWMSMQLSKEQLDYCVDDVQSLSLLRDRQIEACREYGTLGALEFEHALAKPITKMILNGMPLDDQRRRAWHTELQQRIQQSEQRLYGYTDYLLPRGKKRPPELFHNSSNAIKRLLENEYGVIVSSTDKLTLNRLVELETPSAQFAADVLLTRAGRKRIDMYDDEWVEKYVWVDGRVHARYWQVATETGRSTSSDPNLQQIPRDGRGMFGGESGMSVIKADYDSIEVVVAAALSGDENLLEDCRTGDPHSALAAWFTGIPADQLTKDQRRLAKACNFTILFGGGRSLFYEQARMGGSQITEAEANARFSQYLERYPAINRMRNQAFGRSRERHVTLQFPTGLRRDLTGSIRPTIIINNTVQGTAAAGIKMSIVEMYRRGLGDYLGAMVHDENVLVAPDDKAHDVAGELEECMILCMRAALQKVGVNTENVPINCKPEISTHWS